MTARKSASGGEAPKGYRFGRYRLVSPLGVGGMAQVWLARKQIHGGEKVVAVKMPVDLLDLDGNNQAALLNEIHISSQLSHSNIAQVFDAGIHRGVVYMELERIDGVDLEELLGVLRSRQSAVRVDVAVYIWRCVLEALHYAYTYERDGTSCSVIHRDLSPSNVLISSSGEVKVMDFGIAKMQGSDTSGDHIKGKPRYMPPEQIEGRTSTKVDLFASAAIFWEMVEGKQFRHDVPRTEMITRALSGIVPPITSPEVDEYLRDVYQRCTDANPTRRPANPGEVLALLRRWQGRVADPGALREIYEWQLEARRHSGYTDADHSALPDWVYKLVGMLQKIDADEGNGPSGEGTGIEGVAVAIPTPASPAPVAAAEDAPAFFRRGRRSSGVRPPEIRPGIAPTEDAPLPGRPAPASEAPPDRQVVPAPPVSPDHPALVGARAGASATGRTTRSTEHAVKRTGSSGVRDTGSSAIGTRPYAPRDLAMCNRLELRPPNTGPPRAAPGRAPQVTTAIASRRRAPLLAPQQARASGRPGRGMPAGGPAPPTSADHRLPVCRRPGVNGPPGCARGLRATSVARAPTPAVSDPKTR